MSLRSVSSDNFVVVDITGEPNVIAEVSFTAALTTLHEKAIYLHEARQYQVERFDYEGRKAYVRRVDCDYYTDAIDYTQVKALENSNASRLRRVKVPWRRAGEPADRRFKKIKFYTTRMSAPAISRCPNRRCTPPHSGCTFRKSSWCSFLTSHLRRDRVDLAGLGNALQTVAALLLMCDPRDLGCGVQ